MTETIISLVSILMGILGALFLGTLKPKLSLGSTATIIIGVFSAVFIIKSLGRFGFSPNDIIINMQINYFLLLLNLFFSFASGSLGLVLASNLHKKISD